MNTEKMENAFPIVGIGASAGGLEALQEFFKRISSKLNMAFVVVQHLSPDFKSMMKELLGNHTDMPIHIAEDNMEVRPDNIYLIPIKNNIIIKNRVLYLKEKEGRNLVNLPIDLCFNSIGQDVENLAVGIVLSGTGSDGSRGIRTIKELGGLVMVQSPESAKFDGMPKAAIASEHVDFVGTINQIVSKLQDFFKEPGTGVKEFEESQHDGSYEESEEFANTTYDSILGLLEQVSGIRMRDYKKPTILRRIEKRMSINAVPSLDQYYRLLLQKNEETQLLAKECMINVSSFFRDKEAFDFLAEKVIPNVFMNRHDIIRIWSAGCSTGEEPYTLAMIIEEHLEQKKLDTPYKIFASDVDKDALRKGANGIYTYQDVQAITPHFLKKYFDEKDNHYQIKKSVREKIVFATHNAIKDPPFIRLDLITCRNLLIYLKPHVQKKLLLSFQFALNPNSYLFLGSSENLGDLSKEFEDVMGRFKIFTNKPYNRRHNISTGYLDAPSTSPKDNFFDKYLHKKMPWASQVRNFEGLLLSEYLPGCLILNKDLEVLYLSQKIERYLHFPIQQGIISTNITSMVDQNLSLIIRNAVRRLSTDHTENDEVLLFKDVELEIKGKNQMLDVKIKRMEHNEDSLYLVEFWEKKEEKNGKKQVVENVSQSNNEKIKELEKELRIIKEELQATIEELETSNEELQASNEELVSSNEELQSTNEELQSVNEELYTVNTEMQAKQQELIEANNDMNNLLYSTELGTIFLDENGCVRKITPQVKVLFNLMEDDIGRPINHFTNNFNYRDILNDVSRVMETGNVLEKRIKIEDDRQFLMRITPFKTERQEVKGSVIAFIDINKVTEAIEQLESSEQQLQAILNHSPHIVSLLDVNGNIKYINRVVKELNVEDVMGKCIWEFYQGEARTRLRSEFQKMLKTKKNVAYENAYIAPNGTLYVFSEEMVPIIEDGKIKEVVLHSEDITEIKAMTAELVQSEEAYRELLDKLPYIVSKFDSEFRFVYANQTLSQSFNVPRDKILGSDPSVLGIGKEEVALHYKYFKQAWESKETVQYLSEVTTPEGKSQFETFFIPLTNWKGEVENIITLSRQKS